MDVKRLRLGEWVAGLAAVALLVLLFYAWDGAVEGASFRRSVGAPAYAGVVTYGSRSGWAALGLPVLLLVLVAIGTALALVLLTATKQPAALPIGAAVLTTGVGILVLLVLLVRVLLLDDSLGAAYAGLAAMALIPVGGWLAMGDERVRAPYSAAPDLPRRPAPPAGA